MISTVEIKIYFNKKVKRFNVTRSFDDLKQTISKIFNLQPNFDCEFDIFYIDDENDSISLSNEFDYEQMSSFVKNYGLKLLKLMVNPKKNLIENLESFEVKDEIKKQDFLDHSVFQIRLNELKTCPQLKGFEEKHLLNALVLSNGDILSAKERLSNKKINFCEYYDKNKLI